jgi:hypothetical protein
MEDPQPLTVNPSMSPCSNIFESANTARHRTPLGCVGRRTMSSKARSTTSTKSCQASNEDAEITAVFSTSSNSLTSPIDETGQRSLTTTSPWAVRKNSVNFTSGTQTPHATIGSPKSDSPIPTIHPIMNVASSRCSDHNKIRVRPASRAAEKIHLSGKHPSPAPQTQTESPYPKGEPTHPIPSYPIL